MNFTIPSEALTTDERHSLSKELLQQIGSHEEIEISWIYQHNHYTYRRLIVGVQLIIQANYKKVRRSVHVKDGSLDIGKLQAKAQELLTLRAQLKEEEQADLQRYKAEQDMRLEMRQEAIDRQLNLDSWMITNDGFLFTPKTKLTLTLDQAKQLQDLIDSFKD